MIALLHIDRKYLSYQNYTFTEREREGGGKYIDTGCYQGNCCRLYQESGSKIWG